MSTRKTPSKTAQPETISAPREVKWSQLRRLQFIDFRLAWDGKLNRVDLTEFFGISVPQASVDIGRYMELAPGNLYYDRSTREYNAFPAFQALFPSSGAKQYLGQLLALERGILSKEQSLIGFRPQIESVPLPARNIDTGKIAAIVRAMRENGMIEVSYQSISRIEPQWRRISPHALAHDGLRWHVRAYCHLREGFRDFVIGRLMEVGNTSASTIDPSEDTEWHTEIDLVLAPDPRLTADQRQGVEVDYGMNKGRAALKCRRAMLYYTLRSLNFEPTGKPRRGEPQLIIENLDEIKHLLPKFGQA